MHFDTMKLKNSKLYAKMVLHNYFRSYIRF